MIEPVNGAVATSPVPGVVLELTPEGKINIAASATVDAEFLAVAARCLLQLREQYVLRAGTQVSPIVVVPAGVLR